MTPTLDGELKDFDTSEFAKNIRLLPTSIAVRAFLSIRLRIERAFLAGQLNGIRETRLDKS